MKKIAFLFLTLATIFSTAFATSLKIGYINLDEVITTSAQFIEANQAAIKEFKPQEDALLALQEKIKLLAVKFNQDKQDFSESTLKSEIKKITDLERELKQKAAKLQQAFKLKNTQELGKIEDLINQVINEVAKAQKFDLILYQKVAYVSEEVNITPLISEKLRRLFK